MERRIDVGQYLTLRFVLRAQTIGDLITLHITEMCEVGRASLRSKACCLEKLDRALGQIRVRNLDRTTVVDFGRRRAQEGAGPVTVGMEVGYLRLVFLHAASVHGVPVSAEPIEHARIALKRLGLIGNDQTIALVANAGWDPLLLMLEQAELTGRHGRVFPYDGRSVGAAFLRGCRELGICKLRFHDLRHETASRLFEAGYQIPEVALMTGHRDWKMLRRYTNLQPHDLAQRRHLAGGDRAPSLPAGHSPSSTSLLTEANNDRLNSGGRIQPSTAMKLIAPGRDPKRSWQIANDK